MVNGTVFTIWHIAGEGGRNIGVETCVNSVLVEFEGVCGKQARSQPYGTGRAAYYLGRASKFHFLHLTCKPNKNM